MKPDFELRLKSQVDFPSPSKVASDVIVLARNPNIEISKVAQAVSRDPAMTAKILRIANSAFYAQRRPSQNLRQALVIIGLNAALTLALSFSLVSTLRSVQPKGIDYRRFWRRTLLAATASKAFSEASFPAVSEDVFLAALLQDVGILAIDRTSRDFYGSLPLDATHAALMQHEKTQLGEDHSAASALLLKWWNLPGVLWQAVQHSHDPENAGPAKSEQGRFTRCVALGSELAEAALSSDRKAALGKVSSRARELLEMDQEEFTEVVTRVLKLIPEAEELYETSIIATEDAENLLAQARELLTVRNLHTLQEVHTLQETTNVLLSRTEQLEDATRRDPLTGVLNRGWLDGRLTNELIQAIKMGRPLSIAVVDVDHLKKVNDRWGQEAGDGVLHACAQAMQNHLRDSDAVARFADDEFVTLLPGANEGTARNICQRMLMAVREAEYKVGGDVIRPTVSMGVVTCTPQRTFSNVGALLEAAKDALYAAKLRGRNRAETYEDIAAAGGRNSRPRESA